MNRNIDIVYSLVWSIKDVQSVVFNFFFKKKAVAVSIGDSNFRFFKNKWLFKFSLLKSWYQKSNREDLE